MAPGVTQNVLSPIYREKEALASLLLREFLVDELKSRVFFKIVKKVFSIF